MKKDLMLNIKIDVAHLRAKLASLTLENITHDFPRLKPQLLNLYETSEAFLQAVQNLYEEHLKNE